MRGGGPGSQIFSPVCPFSAPFSLTFPVVTPRLLTRQSWLYDPLPAQSTCPPVTIIIPPSDVILHSGPSQGNLFVTDNIQINDKCLNTFHCVSSPCILIYLPQKIINIDIILDCEVCQVSSDIKRCQVMSSDVKWWQGMPHVVLLCSVGRLLSEMVNNCPSRIRSVQLSHITARLARRNSIKYWEIS